jgi:hypothetical protein
MNMAARKDTPARRTGWTLPKAAVLLPPALACAFLAGCASGPLTMDFTIVGDTHTFSYHLDPDGQLSIAGGGQSIAGGSAETVYRDRLDEEAMRRLKKVVAGSGFFLAGPPFGAPMTSGPAMRVQIKLGLWHNRIDTRGAPVPSVSKIVAEVNRHLPQRYALPDVTGPAEREEKEVQKYLKEMGES